MTPMLRTWLKKLFPLPLDDIKAGQVVNVHGVGVVEVKEPQPLGPHSTVFSARREGDEQANMYWRHEIKRDDA